jgi:hypothetical protein
MAKKRILVFADGRVCPEVVTISRKDTVVWLPDVSPNEVTIEFYEVKEVPFKKGVGEWPDNQKKKKGEEPTGTVRTDIADYTRITYQAAGYGPLEQQAKGTPELIVEGGPGPSTDDEPEPPRKAKASGKAKKTAKKKASKKSAGKKAKATSRKKR